MCHGMPVKSLLLSFFQLFYFLTIQQKATFGVILGYFCPFATFCYFLLLLSFFGLPKLFA
jgi:hypothetical protein